jgi:Fe(3+) dicitrate transport protein
MLSRSLFVLPAALLVLAVDAQSDTVRIRELRAAEVVGPYRSGVRAMGDTVGAVILAGKRTSLIDPAAMNADLSVNAARQVFARVPGVSVWESEGSGVQLGIAARGLSPNRSWEFNMRQNGHDICADVFGYPEAYYTPPMEGVERIEVVRGAASLAYGPQFGGLVNFRMKRGANDRPIAVETRQTLGAFGSMNSFNGIGGTKGRWNYYGFLHHRSADGWRRNSRYRTTTAYGALEYRASGKLTLGASFTRMDMLGQQPGGLTDAAFAVDPRSSGRARNWILVPWHTGALTAEWRPDTRTVVDVKLFGTLGERGSVGFLRPVNEPDTVDRGTGAMVARQLDRDRYTNAGLEVRARRGLVLLKRDAQWSVGARAYAARTHRRVSGVGSTGSGPDLAPAGAYTRDLDLATRNGALFSELLLRPSERLALVPGARLEHIVSRVDGRINSSGTGEVDSGARTRQRLLLGIGAQFQVNARVQLYANFSQAYRPVLYSDLTPAATTDVIDPGLRDASGYNADGGVRGQLSDAVQFDIGVFHLHYNDRIGTVLRDGVNYRTNIGTSVSRGVEAYVEADLLRLAGGRRNDRRLAVFGSLGTTDARYTHWNNPAIAEDPLRSIEGKRVEYAPAFTLRTGIDWRCARFRGSVLINRVDGVYTDAGNTEAANATATAGWIPGYTLVDAQFTWAPVTALEATVGVNNVLDAAYATRRSGGYPGPGLLPGTGRSWYITLAARF